jgi:predicted ferric reductase
MRRLLYSIAWIVVYLILVLAPLLVLLIGQERPGRELWREFSIALGFVGLSMMGLQFLLTSRFRPVVRPFGIDVVYHFHRQISIIAFLFILAHPIMLFAFNPRLLSLLNPFTAPLSAIFGLSALILLALVVFLSLGRLRINLKYEPWRITHGLFATGAVILAMLHVLEVGYYIDTPAKRALWIVLGVFWVGTLFYMRILKPILMVRRPYRVEEVRAERGNTHTVVFQPEGHNGMRFRPGQFAWLTVWASPFSIMEHPFSFSSSSLEKGKVALSIKELGDFTSRVKEITPGTRAYLDGPYGVFSIDYHPAPGYVFLAGGVGITPVMSMLRTLADRNDQRPVYLFYGSKDWEGTTFREDIEALKTRMNLTVFYVLEEPTEGWDGPVGYITPDLLAENLPQNRVELTYFICGPELMMQAVEDALDRLGIPPDQLTAERFNLV